MAKPPSLDDEHCMGVIDAAERFTLELQPATPRARLEREIRGRHRERDRVARKDPAYESMRARAFIATSGETLIGVYCPVEDEATLDGVLGHLSLVWKEDFTITINRRIVAVARRHRGRWEVTRFEAPGVCGPSRK